MRIWRYTPLDAVLLLLSVVQLVVTFVMAATWERTDLLPRAAGGLLLVAMISYNIVIVSHVFTHTPWFTSPALNGLVSMLNSINIGQSVQRYEFMHVRNHHRYNNDRGAPGVAPKDLSSTFLHGKDGEHISVVRYATSGAASTLMASIGALGAFTRGWRVGDREHALLDLAAKSRRRRAAELRQIQLDRAAQFVAVGALVGMSWKWVLTCYVPAVLVAFALVNVQNYYEHYGAIPENRFADSVSYYGGLYNLLFFNDGYHQEHHLQPRRHWSRLPSVTRTWAEKLGATDRVISTAPAIVGFAYRRRPLLHRRPVPAPREQDSSPRSRTRDA